MKKGILIIVSVVLAIVLVGIVAFGIVNKDNLKYLLNGAKLYNQQEYEAGTKEAYQKGSANASTLQEENNRIKSQLEEQKLQMAELNSRISVLQNSVDASAETIAGLESQKQTLAEEIARLESIISRYEEVLPDYIGENQVIIKYMVRNELKEVGVNDKNTTISNPYEVTFPEGDVSTFNGWKLGDEQIDLSTYVVTESIILVADITEKVKVTYTVNGTAYSNEILLKGQKPNYPTITGKDNMWNLGWHNGTDKIDTATFVANENVTLNAVYKETLKATFVANDQVQSVQNIPVNENLVAPNNPVQVINGKTSRFNGWKVNDTLVEDLTTYQMTDDTTFVADFSKVVTITVQSYVRTNSGATYYTRCYIEGKINKVEVYEGDVINFGINYYNFQPHNGGACNNRCDSNVCYATTENGSATTSAYLEAIKIVGGFPEGTNNFRTDTATQGTLTDKVSIATEDMNVVLLLNCHNKVY